MDEKQAEDFVNRYAWYFLTKDVHLGTTKPKKYVWNNVENELIKYDANIEGADGQSLSDGNGNIETKCVKNFLTRGNDHDEITGTIPFEIFHSWPSLDKNKKLTRADLFAGWLPGICNAFDYTFYRDEIRKAKQAQGKTVPEVSARTPGALVFVLVDREQNPFCCVAFENIPKLINRLLKLCPDPEGWGLTAPRASAKLAQEYQRPATDEEYWKQWETWNDQRGRIINNMWHVPFRQIAELATVTMIGETDPETKYMIAVFGHDIQEITEELQQGRLKTLKDRAKERGEMSALNPDEALKLIEKFSKDSGIPADKITPVNVEEIEKRFYDPEKLEKMKAEWEKIRQFAKDQYGRKLPTWDERNAQQIAKAQQRIRDRKQMEV